MPKLGVNIDHIATLRQQRKGLFPDVLLAARVCEEAGADSIVAHLREDRRHIQDRDVFELKKNIRTRLNLEMSLCDEIVGIACRLKPFQATIVPEKRRELTTEGGLDVVGQARRVAKAARRLEERGIRVSLFIEPSAGQIAMAGKLEVAAIELHTGHYANARGARERARRLKEIRRAVVYAARLGLEVNAGHGLDYGNVCPISSNAALQELNIGYAIIAQALFVGLERAVKQMKALISSARR